MAKQVLFNSEAKKAFKEGVNIVSDAVGSTLGAAGKTVIISNFHSVPPYATKDGVSVVSSIQLEDEIQNVGALFVRQASQKTMELAGDGTSTTVVLAQSLINNGLSAVESGCNPQDLKIGMDKAIAVVVDEIKSMAETVGDSNEKIRQVATISANNDSVIGNLIGDAYAKIGNNPEGLLVIEESGTIETKIEVMDGVEIPRGYMSPHFANNKDKMEFNYEDCFILVADYTISQMKDFVPLFNQIAEKNLMATPILIVAQDFEGEAYSSMLQNNVRGNVKCCLMKAPSSYRKETMDDIAILTGATMLSDANGLKLEHAKIEHLGKAKKIVVSEKKCLIIKGDGQPSKVAAHIHEISLQRDELKTTDALRDVWNKRLANLSGRIGVIKVGGATDVEVKEKKDRVDDACRAVKSAIEEGIVTGGGVSLLRCSEKLVGMNLDGPQMEGVKIVDKMLYAPLKKMIGNAGLDNKETLIIATILSSGEKGYGYNIKTRSYENLLENGVIDPVKVIRCALQNAASVAGAIITSDCLIVEMKEKK